jgi:hypothetical protein
VSWSSALPVAIFRSCSFLQERRMGIERFAMGDTARKGNLRTLRLVEGCLNVSCVRGIGRFRSGRLFRRLGCRGGFEQGADGLDLFGREFGKAASLAAAGSFQGGDSSFADQVELVSILQESGAKREGIVRKIPWITRQLRWGKCHCCRVRACPLDRARRMLCITGFLLQL